MVNPISEGILITALGMGLVFLMIVVLWGIMAALVALTNAPAAENDDQTEAAPTALNPQPSEQEKLAAAAAVACALSLAPKTHPLASSTAGTSASAWLSAGRTQQVLSSTQKGRRA